MKSFFILIISIFSLALLTGCASLSEPGERYRETLEIVNTGNMDFAFLQLKTIVDDYPSSVYAPQATFAIGEYYFDIGDYFNALKLLFVYIHQHPKDRGVIFAKLILYKIITMNKTEVIIGVEEDTLIKEIRKELFAQPLFLIFYDKKQPRSYKSFFRNSYLVYDYVDKIRVFRNGTLFLELLP